MRQVHLRLPATSANLGPGFDSLALALKLYLHIDAEPSEQFTIEASGRDAKICGASENNLLIGTYTEVLASQNRAWVPLKVGMHNEIPLGMGCGSSAAVRLAAVALASISATSPGAVTGSLQRPRAGRVTRTTRLPAGWAGSSPALWTEA